MSGRIPEEKIEEIRKASDIVDVIGDYIQLKKQGRNMTGLCPFHGEKTPSFSVSPDKQLYHCFGCGAGGNVFSFIMESEGISFIESVQRLGERAGIDLPELAGQSQGDSKEKKREKYWISAHELTVKLFQHVLLNTEEGRDAREYLENRGMDHDMIERFQLGYAPDSWDFLTSFLSRRNFDMDEMMEAGLLARREFDKKPFDRFRDRIMFPVWNRDGKAIGFTGRVLGDGKPKYMNSPESSLFDKSRILYGFHLARPSMRKKNEAVLFEGNADVISAWRAGIDNGIAAMGTALTDRQVKMIKRNADRVLLCYDADDAGQNAAYKNAELLEKAGMSVRVAKMEEGLDPDDFIREKGAERFRNEVIDGSLTYMGFKFRYFRKGINLQDEGDRIEYVEKVLQEISKLPRAVERDHYVRQLAEEFNLSLDALKQELIQLFKAGKRKKQRESGPEVKERRPFAAQAGKRLLPAYANAERHLLAHMLRDAEAAFRVQDKLGAAFNIDNYHAIAAHLYSYYAEGHEPSISRFVEKLEDEKLRRIVSELAMMTISSDLSEQELDDYARQILNYPKKLEIEKKKQEQRAAEDAKDYPEAARIAMEIQQMEQQLKNSMA
ncbi:DNA primase [Alteribacter natronophilus]|uniref:DNA primase n=1 Tax=Alteribacter natronophilus TaxID=2583810 RepID=UPI00110D5C85|nr:DNA primase [Alteribacter natronophilus]TMW73844.1 DNA primase [Alteribacter natronophilus]